MRQLAHRLAVLRHDHDRADRDRRLALGGPLEWLSVLGTTGVTAYVGIHDIGQVRAGRSVLVSAATGAVGGVAVQFAKAAGARVVAIAGGRDRAAIQRARPWLGRSGRRSRE